MAESMFIQSFIHTYYPTNCFIKYNYELNFFLVAPEEF